MYIILVKAVREPGTNKEQMCGKDAYDILSVSHQNLQELPFVFLLDWGTLVGV